MCLFNTRPKWEEDVELSRPNRNYYVPRPSSSQILDPIIREPPKLKKEPILPTLEERGNEQQALGPPLISIRTATVPQYIDIERSREDSQAASSWSRDGSGWHSSRTSTKSTRYSLKEKLRHARRESRQPHSFFVPESSLEELITVEAVARDIRVRNENIGEEDALAWANAACESARKLYAVLAYIKKGADIGSLLGEHIEDDVLPLVRVADDQGYFGLMRRSGKPIVTLDHWSESAREKFDRIQWWMTSPIFEDNLHYELDDETILPFIRFKNGPEPKQGGYSEVYPVRIHPAHQNFWKAGPEENEPLVAIKKLFSPDKMEFEKEVSILKALGSKRHPHLIRLLATYRMGDKYHIMFPYATANLRTYWEDRPSPAFDKDTVLWSMNQMMGLANALVLIHNFTVTVPLSVAGPGAKRVQKDAELSVVRGEEFYGRHGDIKPENILWFKGSAESSDRHGVLQIADFGLGRFHGRDSRSRVNPDTIAASPTYEPPECKLRRPVSRNYDLWSLGCLYLEFVTWLLKGGEEIENFADFRGQDNPATGINDDNFFTITRDPATGSEAVVREQVILWVQELHEDEKCPAMIHDLLDLIMKDLLVVEGKDRTTANWLFQQLKLSMQRAEFDMDYLLKPVPFRRALSAHKTTEPQLFDASLQTRSSQRRVNFTTRTPKEISFKAPRDLVLRSAGTPSRGGRLTRSGTWPAG